MTTTIFDIVARDLRRKGEEVFSLPPHEDFPEVWERLKREFAEKAHAENKQLISANSSK